MAQVFKWHGFRFEHCKEDSDTHSGVPIPEGWRVTDACGAYVIFASADADVAKFELTARIAEK